MATPEVVEAGVMAPAELRDRLPAGSVCVAILPDRGERYLDTLFDDDWVRLHFGDVAEQWSDLPRAPSPS